MATDFAFELGTFSAIVVIDIGVRGITQRADRKRRDLGRVDSLLNRTKRFAVIRLILSQKQLIIFTRLNGLFS